MAAQQAHLFKLEGAAQAAMQQLIGFKTLVRDCTVMPVSEEEEEEVEEEVEEEEVEEEVEEAVVVVEEDMAWAQEEEGVVEDMAWAQEVRGLAELAVGTFLEEATCRQMLGVLLGAVREVMVGPIAWSFTFLERREAPERRGKRLLRVFARPCQSVSHHSTMRCRLEGARAHAARNQGDLACGQRVSFGSPASDHSLQCSICVEGNCFGRV